MEPLLFRPMTDSEIENWYKTELTEAFAPQECKPLPDIFRLRAQGRYELWGLFDAAALLGYATIWKAPDVPLVLLDYLGVTTPRRGSGLGGEILRRLQAQGRPMVVESETPIPGAAAADNGIRVRRIAFYRRSGFAPRYEMATCGLRWQALVFLPAGASFTQTEIMTAHGALYGPERTDVQVPLAPEELPPDAPYWMK